jgi:hypothetical protein
MHNRCIGAIKINQATDLGIWNVTVSYAYLVARKRIKANKSCNSSPVGG